MIKERYKILFFTILIFLGGFSVGFFFKSNDSIKHPEGQIKPLRQSDLYGKSTYKYIDPLVALSNSQGGQEYLKLQVEIEKLITSEKKSGNIIAASVKFGDYGKSSGFLINSTEQYYPSSLMKVPTMITYLKISESNPSILQKNLYYSGITDANAQESIKSPVQLLKKKYYSVNELIDRMIKNSDNNATELLINNLNSDDNYEVFNELFKNLGIDEIDLNDDYITVNGASIFFRVLYNSTYLSRDLSEKAMEILTETDFKRGISQGVDQNIAIAQKFGEFTKTTQEGNIVKRELHNCGIIYYPEHPYLLCVMTKGTDFTKLESFISSVSQKIFKQIRESYS